MLCQRSVLRRCKARPTLITFQERSGALRVSADVEFNISVPARARRGTNRYWQFLRSSCETKASKLTRGNAAPAEALSGEVQPAFVVVAVCAPVGSVARTDTVLCWKSPLAAPCVAGSNLQHQQRSP
jgi:hypothetical protein